MNKRKGFTLVELVIVIAVIAVLAGILIGTFAFVLGRANKSAEIQRVKSEELAVKADDILKKIEDSNWYGWADFENSIVEKITAAVKTEGNSFNETAMKNAVKEALVEYGVKTGNDYSTLTEEQVKAIVENALGTLKYEGVTEDQVRAIVNTATNTLAGTQLSSAQVRAIVNAANTNNLTQAQVAAIVANALSTTEGELSAKIDAAVNALKGDISGIVTLTEEEVVDIITNLVPVTRIAKSDDATENEGFAYFVDKLLSGSTIVIDESLCNDEDVILNLTLAEPDVIKTLCIKANDKFTGVININAPEATIYIVGDFSDATINVIAIADNSLHVNGKVGTLTLNKGRTVIEEGSSVGTLVAIPSKESTVKVVIEESAKVNDLYAQYQDHGNKDDSDQRSADFIEIENNGTVGTSRITASAALASSTIGTTTNVKITNGPDAKGTNVSNVEVPATIAENLEEIVGYALPVEEAQATLEVNGTETDPVGYVITTGDEGTVIEEAKGCDVLGHDLIGIYCNRCKHPVAFVDEINDFKVSAKDPEMPVVDIFNGNLLGDPLYYIYLDVTYSFKAFPNMENKNLDNVTLYKLNISDFTFTEKTDNDTEGPFFTAKSIFDFFSDWNCDYYVSFDESVEAESCGLGGYYEAWGATLGFLAPQEIPENTEIPLLGYMLSGGESNWTYAAIAIDVGEFKCGFFNLSEDNVGKTFTVKLRMLNPDAQNHNVLENVYNEDLGISLPSYIDVAVTNYVITSPSEENLEIVQTYIMNQQSSN